MKLEHVYVVETGVPNLMHFLVYKAGEHAQPELRGNTFSDKRSLI